MKTNKQIFIESLDVIKIPSLIFAPILPFTAVTPAVGATVLASTLGMAAVAHLAQKALGKK